MIDADGSWFCPGCHSLNRASASRCYSCRAASPFAVAPAPASVNRWVLPGVLALALLLAAGSTAAVMGRSMTSVRTIPTPVTDMIANGGEASPSLEATAIHTPTPTPLVATTPPPTPEPAPVVTLPPLSVASPTDATVALPRFPVSIKGVKLVWFSVKGTTPAALINSMEAGAAKPCVAGALACFDDAYSWTTTGSVDPVSGVCTVTSVDLTITYTITLPKWNRPSRVPAALVPWWKQVLAHIVWHESQHLAIAKKYAPSIKAAALNGPCTSAGSKAAVNAAMVPMEKAQKAFDAQQTAANWQYPAYDGTWN